MMFKSIVGYPTESFSQLENLKTMEIRVLKIKTKRLYGCHYSTRGAWLVEVKFSEWKFSRKKSPKAGTSNSKPFWRYGGILYRRTMCPLAWLGLVFHQVILAVCFFLAVRCQAHGVGIFMSRNNDVAHYNDRIGVTYTCNPGYSFTESNVRDRRRTLICQEDGTLQRLRDRCTGVVLYLSLGQFYRGFRSPITKWFSCNMQLLLSFVKNYIWFFYLSYTIFDFRFQFGGRSLFTVILPGVLWKSHDNALAW